MVTAQYIASIIVSECTYIKNTIEKNNLVQDTYNYLGVHMYKRYNGGEQFSTRLVPPSYSAHV